MPTYLYCLLGPASEPPRDVAGVAGAPVRVLSAGGLVAWVSDVTESPRPSLDALRAHDAVTRAALESGETPVPARFGQTFADDAACGAALAARESALRRARERVAGCVEMTLAVRIARPESGPPGGAASATPSAGAGHAYMERLRAAASLERIVHDQARLARAAIVPRVAHLVRGEASVVTVAPPLLTLSHLVPREAVEPYRRAVGALELGDISTGTAVRGPSAPYSFVTVNDG